MQLIPNLTLEMTVHVQQSAVCSSKGGGKGLSQRAGRRGLRCTEGNTTTRQQSKTNLEAAAEKQTGGW